MDDLLKLWHRQKDETTAADAIYSTLREAILQGVLAGGYRLGEAELASLFKRSRTPIREAILRLESEGLAQRQARRGLIVGTISREEILEVYTVREVLDGLAARLAAQTILPADLEHLKWLNRRLQEASEHNEFATALQLNFEFHETLCSASHNKLLLQFTRQIHDWVRRFQDTTFSYPGRSFEAVQEHAELLAALGERNADVAEHIARRHMARAMEIRISMLQSGDGFVAPERPPNTLTTK